MLIALRIFLVISFVFCFSNGRDYKTWDDQLILTHVVSCKKDLSHSARFKLEIFIQMNKRLSDMVILRLYLKDPRAVMMIVEK